MSLQLEELVNPNLQSLHAYEAGKRIEEIERELGITDLVKLASNENPLGPSPKAIAAAQEASESCEHYPDGSAYLLKQAIAQNINVDAERLTLGNGSDNVISMIAQVFLKPDAEVIIPEFSFSTFSLVARIHHGTVVTTPAKDWGANVTAMAKAVTDNTKLIFIANPNNPTGTWLDEEDLMTLMDSIPNHVIVVVDEAYHEYVYLPRYPNTIDLQQKYPNLIVTRTFSKIYGLAGLRIGYSVSRPELSDYLNRVRLPFNVSLPAQAAAIAALKDHRHIRDSIDLNKKGMARLQTAFTEMQRPFIPSVGNFITFDVGQEALPIYNALLQEGVIVRPLEPYAMPNHLRVSVGKLDEIDRFVKALQHVL